MKKLKQFSVHGTALGSDKSIKLDEISILAAPETIRELGEFLIRASCEMATNELEHLHLQDFIENFSREHHVDFIAINKKLVKL